MLTPILVGYACKHGYQTRELTRPSLHFHSPLVSWLGSKLHFGAKSMDSLWVCNRIGESRGFFGHCGVVVRSVHGGSEHPLFY